MVDTRPHVVSVWEKRNVRLDKMVAIRSAAIVRCGIAGKCIKPQRDPSDGRQTPVSARRRGFPNKDKIVPDFCRRFAGRRFVIGSL